MQQVGELLPVGSIVLLKGGTKKTMIMGVLQTDEEHPRPFMIIWEFHIRKGTWEKKVYIFFSMKISMISFFEDMKIQRETK